MLYLIKVLGFKVGNKGKQESCIYRIGTGIHEHVLSPQFLDEISVEGVNLRYHGAK